jgi:protein-S-isoprenylcysteine O-methyltransferase Ste14
MLYVLRHLISIAALPFTMTVLIPAWILRGATGGRGALPEALPRAAWMTLGALIGGVGLALFVTSLRRFATDGEGTLAPWDPPRRLVVRGPYRHVRNPMISGVVCIILAESLLLDSRALFTWGLTFLAINAVYIPLLEEPQLRQRFGASYDEYSRHVPRLVPRLSPWRQ